MDKKANSVFHKALRRVAECFPNVFVAKECLNIVWGLYDLLRAEYFSNPTGMEYPLKTNWEIVQILRAMKGANIIKGSYQK